MMTKIIGQSVTLAAVLLLAGLGICLPSKSLADDLPANMKPLAMDERVKIVDANSPEALDGATNQDDASKSENATTSRISKSESMSIQQKELHNILSDRESEIFPDPIDKQSMSSVKQRLSSENQRMSSENMRVSSDSVLSPESKPIYKSSPLKSIDDEKNLNMAGQTLYREPKETSVKLTQAITGPNPPTFMKESIVHPIRKKGDKVIASYRFMVPIFIPAFKPVKSSRIGSEMSNSDMLGSDMLGSDKFGSNGVGSNSHGSNKFGSNGVGSNGFGSDESKARSSAESANYNGNNQNFVEEDHIEMVPVKKEGKPQLKQVYKAERVPQRVITDFVLVDGKTLPNKVSDQVQPGEKVIKTIVTDF